MKTILLVETDAAAEADAAALRSLGYAVVSAGSGQQAVELAGAGQAIDLILMDLELGVPAEGAQAADEILARREVPILLMTAQLGPEAAARARGVRHAGLLDRNSGPLVWQAGLETALELFEARQRLRQTDQRAEALAERKLAELMLRESDGRLHQILSALHEAIWLRDVKTRQVLYVNPAFEQICGLRREAFYQDPDAFINLVHPDDQSQIQKTTIYRSDIHRIVRPDGSVRWVWGRTFPVNNEAGEVYRTAAILEDITDRKQTEEALKQANERLLAQVQEIQLLQSHLRDQAIRDPLTGLHNRRYLDETLDRELARAVRERYPVTLVIIDVDGFKRVNDSHGHYAGDLVLKQLALQLTRQTRASDLVCRLGGDEFLLVFPNLAGPLAYERAEQCRRTFQDSPVLFEGQSIQATLSLGVAQFPEAGPTSRELLIAADRALYAAKGQGRNRVVIEK